MTYNHNVSITRTLYVFCDVLMSVSRLHLEARRQKAFFGGNYVKKLRIFTVLATMFVGQSVFGGWAERGASIKTLYPTGDGHLIFRVESISDVGISKIAATNCPLLATDSSQRFIIRNDHPHFNLMVDMITLAYATGDYVRLQLNTNYCSGIDNEGKPSGYPAIFQMIVRDNK